MGFAVVAIGVAAFLIGRASSGDDENDHSDATRTETTSEAAPERTIELAANGDTVERIGTLDVGTADPSVARAVFGRQSLLVPEGESCGVEWGDIGLLINFANFGGADACGPEGAVATASIGSEEGVEEGWVTDQGLALGDDEAKLRELYPRAAPPAFEVPDPKYEGERLVLASTYTPYGEGGDIPTLTAVLAGGEVIAFDIYVGAAGE